MNISKKKMLLRNDELRELKEGKGKKCLQLLK